MNHCSTDRREPVSGWGRDGGREGGEATAEKVMKEEAHGSRDPLGLVYEASNVQTSNFTAFNLRSAAAKQAPGA